jgi:hypothetical protein
VAQRSIGLSFSLCGPGLRCLRGSLPALLVSGALLLVGLRAAPAAAEAPTGAGWDSLEAESLTIYFRDGDGGLARAIEEIGPSTINYISTATGTPIPEHVDVILAADATSFAKLQPSAPPTWAVGTAWPNRREIYLRTGLPHTGPDPIQKTFTHELCHIMVGSVFEDGRPPRWLQEGVAMLFAGEMRPSDQAVLVRAAAGGSLLPLSEIARHWPSRSRQAHLAYLQSVDFVAYLFRQGEGVLATVISKLAEGRSLEQAVASATSQPLGDLEDNWRRRLTIWHAIIPLVAGPNAFWVFACGLFMVAAWKRRGQKRAKLALLEERERLAAQGADDADSGLC